MSTRTWWNLNRGIERKKKELGHQIGERAAWKKEKRRRLGIVSPPCFQIQIGNSCAAFCRDRIDETCPGIVSEMRGGELSRPRAGSGAVCISRRRRRSGRASRQGGHAPSPIQRTSFAACALDLGLKRLTRLAGGPPPLPPRSSSEDEFRGGLCRAMVS